MTCKGCDSTEPVSDGYCRTCLARRFGQGHQPEPTAAELEATVAAQAANLPAWWGLAETYRDGPGREPKLLARAAPRGRWNGRPL